MLTAVHMDYKLAHSLVTDMVYHTVKCDVDFELAVEMLRYSCESVLLI